MCVGGRGPDYCACLPVQYGLVLNKSTSMIKDSSGTLTSGSSSVVRSCQNHILQCGVVRATTPVLHCHAMTCIVIPQCGMFDCCHAHLMCLLMQVLSELWLARGGDTLVKISFRQSLGTWRLRRAGCYLLVCRPLVSSCFMRYATNLLQHNVCWFGHAYTLMWTAPW